MLDQSSSTRQHYVWIHSLVSRCHGTFIRPCFLSSCILVASKRSSLSFDPLLSTRLITWRIGELRGRSYCKRRFVHSLTVLAIIGYSQLVQRMLAVVDCRG